mmetsp:Transcript_4513/g.5443  ORF Transcript_4513/g.5443 Transcript_4513/m.5443 type:complete len:131 (+) Transcript_4513:708-1100(+)
MNAPADQKKIHKNRHNSRRIRQVCNIKRLKISEDLERTTGPLNGQKARPAKAARENCQKVSSTKINTPAGKRREAKEIVKSGKETVRSSEPKNELKQNPQSSAERFSLRLRKSGNKGDKDCKGCTCKKSQ